ncbi:LysR family transcriptional regulator [Spongisporangium articulatum]|uniref:LysR family transcriptional regulator n=1 Tax=Spongisporangium articulatum TaxID=3362603 RepID=A0ABW8APB1_9ACTN
MESFSPDFIMDLRRLRVLREVERRGTVSAAAETLHLTPSAVSQQVAGLARELGVPLLERNGRRVRLTGQARVLLEHADVVQEQLRRARADLAAFADGEVGQVRIGSLSTGISAVVAPALTRLRETRPGLQLQVSESEPPESFERLDRGEFDLIVSCDHQDAPNRHDRRFHRVDLLVDRMDAVLPVDHPLADPTGVRLADLSREQWVSAHPNDPCSVIMQAVCAGVGFSPDVRHFCREWDAAAALVAAGAGVALVPRTAQPLRQPGLVVSPVVDTMASRLVYAAVRAGAEDDPAVAAALTGLREVASRSENSSDSL